jgi:hypothetical protein
VCLESPISRKESPLEDLRGLAVVNGSHLSLEFNDVQEYVAVPAGVDVPKWTFSETQTGKR